jgi:hypothetical protein
MRIIILTFALLTAALLYGQESTTSDAYSTTTGIEERHDQASQRIENHEQRRSDQVERRHDRAEKAVENRTERRSDFAESKGRTQAAERIERRGDKKVGRIERHEAKRQGGVERRHDRAERKVDRHENRRQ